MNTLRRHAALPSLLACLFLTTVSQVAAASGVSTTTALAVTSGGTAVATVSSGSVVTLTATVKATGAVTTGLVKFCDATSVYCTDIHLLGTAQLTSAGTATFSFVPGIGGHIYKAVFAGTSANATSTSSQVGLTVTGLASGSGATTTAIAVSGSAGNYTLKATVTGAPGLASPTGTVSFLDTSDTNYALGMASLAAAGTSGSGYTTSTLSVDGVTAFGDFNGDGKQDVVTFYTYSGIDTITLQLGNGDGSFTTKSSFQVGDQPNYAVVGDFNGDGKLDVAAMSTNSVAIYLGNGDGTLTAKATVSLNQPSTTAGAVFMAIGDFNNDGKADLVTVNNYGDNVTALLGNGDGTFTTVVGPYTGLYPETVAVADFNGDGNQDLAVGSAGNGPGVTILLGNGDGTFTKKSGPVTSGGGSSYYVPVVAADFNGDGKMDLAYGLSTANTVAVLLGNGDGTFTTRSTLTLAAGPTTLAVGDFNADGRPDLVIGVDSPGSLTQTTEAVAVYTGNGDGTLTSSFTAANSTSSSTIAVADLNGDGIPDLAIDSQFGGFGSTTLVVSQSASLVSTASVTGIAVAGSGTHLVDASYAGDSAHSASVSATTGLAAQMVSTKLTLTASPASSTFGQQVVLSAVLSPYSAQNLTTNGQTIAFFNGQTSLGTATLSNGVATLNITSLPVGTASIKAQYNSDNNFAAYISSIVTETVTPGLAARPLGGTAASQNATPGGTAAYSLDIAPTGASGFASAVSFSVSGLPTGATATFSPATLPAGGAETTVALAIGVPTTANLQPAPDPFRRHTPLVVCLLLLPLLAARRRARRGASLLLVLLLSTAGLLSLSGCTPTTPATSTVAPRTYNLVVTAASGSVTSTTNLTLIVQ